MRAFWLFCGLLFGAASAAAQGTVRGQVFNEDAEPMAGATVLVANTYKGVSTDSKGRFELRNVQSGEQQIEVRFLGYTTAVKDVAVVAGEVVVVDVTLSPSAFISEEVVISATRADEKTPTTYTNMTKAEVEEANFGQDLPYLLNQTPSVVVSSDAGAGVGYTGVRIRGSDQTRTNITINGIPVNDAESHGVFWVNMPDFASSVENIQIQRGVGTSTNGAAAFGASLNIQTNTVNQDAYAELDNAVGSFNTIRNTVKAGTGVLKNGFSVDARLSRIASDGYVDRASSDLKSYYLAGSWQSEKSLLRANVFGGGERTYQSWNGVTKEQLKTDRTYNSAGLYYDENGEEQFYDNEVDQYQQHHYHLHFTHRFSNRFYASISGHYTRGAGYYEQYRQDDKFGTYGLDPVYLADDTLTRTDLIRRRWLDNHFYGGVFSLNYNNLKGLELTLGGGLNQYDGDHYGEIIWARFASQSDIRDRYYDNNALKTEGSAYIKATYQIGRATVFGDVQYRAIDYRFEGFNVVNEEFVLADQKVNYNFLNPKVGLMFDINDRNNVYASFGVSHREPIRRDFTESTPDSRPAPEQLRNLEAGYRFKGSKWYLNANYFLMDYKDQLVVTGEMNDVGAYTRKNVSRSYRTGIELQGGVRLLKRIDLSANVAYSQNRILGFQEFVDDYDQGGQLVVDHGNTAIALSPDWVMGATLQYEPTDGLKLAVLPKYVSEQFLDNTSNRDRMIDAFFVTDFRASYTVKDLLFKEVSLGLLVNNIFDTQYQSSGYTFSYVAGGELTTENYFFPQAGTNFMLSLTLKM